MATNSGNSGNSGEFSLTSIMQTASTAMENMNASVAQLEQLSAQGTAASDSLVAAMQSSVDARGDTALSLQTRKLGELEAQERKAEFRAALGMDLDGAARISNALAASYQQTTMLALEQAKGIQQRESVGLLDNPLAYIFNQLVLPDERNALQSTLVAQKVAGESLNQVNQALHATAQNEAAYAKTLSAASIDSQVEGMKNEMIAKGAEVKMKAIQFNAHNVQTIMQARRAELDTLFAVVSARNASEQLALSKEAASRERVRFDEWQKDQKDIDIYVKDMTAYANATAKSLGKPEFTKKQVELAMKGRAVPGVQQMVQQYAQNGFINANSGALGLRYGETPTAALEFATATNTPATPAVQDIYSRASANVSKIVTAEGLNKNDKKAMDMLYNKEVKKLTRGMIESIDARDGTNSYRIPALKVLGQNPEIAESPFYKLLAPEIAAGGLKEADPDALIAKGIEAVKANKLTFSQLASGLQLLFKTGVQLNNAEKQFGRFGMPEQTTYNARVKVPNVVIKQEGAYRTLFAPEPVTPQNLLDLSVINRLLVKKIAADSVPDFNDNISKYQSVIPGASK